MGAFFLNLAAIVLVIALLALALIAAEYVNNGLAFFGIEDHFDRLTRFLILILVGMLLKTILLKAGEFFNDIWYAIEAKWAVVFRPDKAEDQPPMMAGDTNFESSFDKLLEDDDLGEDMFGVIDLVFRGATDAEAAVMTHQFMSQDIFQGSMPSHKSPSSFGRPVNEIAVRIIYHREIFLLDLTGDDSPKKQQENVEAAYKELRLKLPDGRSWEITKFDHITWLPFNKLTYDTTILLDQVKECT